MDVSFNVENHEYFVDNEKYESVTTVLKSYFGVFDSDGVIDKMFMSKSWGLGHKYWGMTKEDIKRDWELKGLEACKKGTEMHKMIEDYYNGLEVECEWVEWLQFKRFVGTMGCVRPFRAEWRVYDKEYKIAGTIDMTYYDEVNDEYWIYDWKRSKDINMNRYGKCNEPIAHLYDNNYNKYALQLSMYKYILEKQYNIKVSKLMLVQFHSEIDEYKCIPVMPLMSEIEKIFECRSNVNI